MATQYVESPTTTPCQCPSCRGLECFERPRFFAGQLLTEAELNSEQGYVLAKNRLHNRYLHGWGVVCGLEVVCHACKGWVRVRSGYAIDPCGNDVVVCRDHDLNVLAEIQKCREAKKRSAGDCDEFRQTKDPCVDMDEHWCIALQYRESETRGITPLQEKPKAASNCGCGCGGGTTATPSLTRPTACEPTRTLEQYRLTVIPEPPSCAKGRESGVRRAVFPRPGSLIAAILPERWQRHPMLQTLVAAAPAESLLARAISVFDTVEQFFTAKFNVDQRAQLLEIARVCLRDTSAEAARVGVILWSSSSTPDDLCRSFRRAVCELYAQDPLGVACGALDCPPCSAETTTSGTGSGQTIDNTLNPIEVARFDQTGQPSTTNNDLRLSPAMCCLVNAVVTYLTKAVCSLLIPPCPPEPCDERVILACVTVSKDDVVSICNHGCRRYAGSFPALEYWASAVPIAAMLREIVSEICCSDRTAQAITEVKARYRDWLGTDTVAVDPKVNPATGKPDTTLLPGTPAV